VNRIPDGLRSMTMVTGFGGKRQGPHLYRSADVAKLLAARAAA
jgi:hypothetical protein